MNEALVADTARRRLRVLHVGKYFPPFRGGMETYLRDLMAALAALDVSSSALVHDHEKGFRGRRSTLSTPSGDLPVYRAARWLNLSFAPISPGFPLALWQMIRQEKPDLLHFHLPNASAFWALVLPRARRLPWVVHWHSDVPESLFVSRWWLKPLAPLYRTLERTLLRKAACIIGTSPQYVRTSPTLAEFSKECVVIPLGITASPVAEVSSKENAATAITHGPLRVLSVGRFSYYKGFAILLEALSMAPAVELKLVGDGELKSELQALAGALSIESRVTFLGSISDEELEVAWDWCDCLCLPSIERTEAFGIVLLEAMSRGKACIVSNVHGSGMGWLVEQGVTGLKVQPGNAKALSEALLSAKDDRSRLAKMGRAGKAKFIAQLSMGISSHRVKEVYENVTTHA